MISRTAFTQLRHSTVLLCATIVGMLVIYLAPPVLIFNADSRAAILALAAWIAMAISYIPTLRSYRRSISWPPLLPVIALFYIGATIESAIQYWTGKGGVWKDRVQGGGDSIL
jgi:hypothetical protein